jgi:transposase
MASRKTSFRPGAVLAAIRIADPLCAEAVSQTLGLSGWFKKLLGMAQNFIECDREQLLLMSPSLREWLPEDHLAWFVIDAVEDMDLSAFYARYRQDGWGRAVYDPAMMVAIVLYAYAKVQRSSRGIERACVEDVAYRVIASNHAPDHVTINRFRAEHSDALAGLFGSVLTLCARAGMVKVGKIAVDGTKVHANASRDANADYKRIAREILEEAAAVDAAEDELYGEKRGDELPEHLSTSAYPVTSGRVATVRRWLGQTSRARSWSSKSDSRQRPRALTIWRRRAGRRGSSARGAEGVRRGCWSAVICGSARSAPCRLL